MAVSSISLSVSGWTSVPNVIYFDTTKSKYFSDSACTKEIVSAPIPTSEGYRFEGYYWYSGRYGTIEFTDASGLFLYQGKPSSSYNLRIRSTRVSYKITLSTEGGTPAYPAIYRKIGAAANEPKFYVDDLCAIPVNKVFAIQDGFKFNGYYSSAEGGTQYIDENGYILPALASLSIAGALIFYAAWVDFEPTPQFNVVEDYFNLGIDGLVPKSSSSGVVRTTVSPSNGGVGDSHAFAQGCERLNPSVVYEVTKDITLNVILGKAYPCVMGGGSMMVSGYFITSVDIETRIGSFPIVTISATANEGADAINLYPVSFDIKGRARAQNILGAFAGGGEIRSCKITASCSSVVLEENLSPCASDVVNGNITVSAEVNDPRGVFQPFATNGFGLLNAPKVRNENEYLSYSIVVRKEI